MQLELINTFADAPQTIVTYPFVNSILESRETFIEFATAMLTEEEATQLVKISACVYYASDEVTNCEWFKECNGKFYFHQEATNA